MKCENCGKEIGDSWIGGINHDHFFERTLREIHFCPYCGHGLIKQKDNRLKNNE